MSATKRPIRRVARNFGPGEKSCAIEPNAGKWVLDSPRPDQFMLLDDVVELADELELEVSVCVVVSSSVDSSGQR